MIDTVGRRTRGFQYLTAAVRTQPGSNPPNSSENTRKPAWSTPQGRRWRRCRPGCIPRPASAASASGFAFLRSSRRAWPCWCGCRTCTRAPDIPARDRRPRRRRPHCGTTAGRSRSSAGSTIGFTFGRNVCRIRSRRSEIALARNSSDALIAELAFGDGGANHLVVDRGEFCRRPERIVGPHVPERRVGDVRPPLFGIPLRMIARQAADRRRFEIILRAPHRDVEAERQRALADLAGLFDQRLVTFPAFARADRGAAERRSEIEQVMADEAAAVLGDRASTAS